MNYCPTCGKKVGVTKCIPDTATEHYTYECSNNHKWEETLLKDGEVLNISPIEEEERDIPDNA